MRRILCSLYLLRILVVLFAVLPCAWQPAISQQLSPSAPGKSVPNPPDSSEEKKTESKTPENPAQIELLETRIRFEENGDSRKEVHAHVKINTELGARQFARLKFDYNRSFQSIGIPLVRVSHANGGTSDVLPSAVTDNPNSAVVDAPVYQDVRVKSVRILGLTPGDSLDYRVVTTVSHHPLAPDFWLDHTFDRTGVVSQEIFELDLPASSRVQFHVNPQTPEVANEMSTAGDLKRITRRWEIRGLQSSKSDGKLEEEADVSLTTFQSWDDLGEKLARIIQPQSHLEPAIGKLAEKLTGNLESDRERIQAIYEFVCQRIETVDLPLGATGFKSRPPTEIQETVHATPEDKFALFYGLASSLHIYSAPAFAGSAERLSDHLPTPSSLTNLLITALAKPKLAQGNGCGDCEQMIWLDPAIPVAPFEVIPATLRGRQALYNVRYGLQNGGFAKVPRDIPFPSMQTVRVSANLSADGTLTAKVKYNLRGDNELLLRVAFHQTAKDKWKDLANLLAISDGFRGQVTSVNVSDPYATREPFNVDYEITMPKFVDWSKKPVRIPALLPQVALPDPPAKPVAGSAVSPIELGTPLEIETSMTLRLPAGTTARYPTGTSVERDYATFSSQYARNDSTVSASRHIKFILREVPAARVFDYNAFLRAVQNDSTQDFILERQETPPTKTDSAVPAAVAPSKVIQPNPDSAKP